MVPVLSAFIAFAIADRPGIAPGLICGQLAVNVGSGFIGGIIAGLLCGYLANVLKRLSCQNPCSLFVYHDRSYLYLASRWNARYLRNRCPLRMALQTLTKWLTGMSGASAILVGAICGAMIGFEKSRPLNKKLADEVAVVVTGLGDKI